MSTIRTNTLSNVAGTQSTAIENAINGSAKAWVNFNGTGTVAIRGQYNVSSITDLGTGCYTVNFTNPLPDGNYSAIADVAPSIGSSMNVTAMYYNRTNDTNPAPTAAGFTFTTYVTGNSPTGADSTYVTVAVFR